MPREAVDTRLLRARRSTKRHAPMIIHRRFSRYRAAATVQSQDHMRACDKRHHFTVSTTFPSTAFCAPLPLNAQHQADVSYQHTKLREYVQIMACAHMIWRAYRTSCGIASSFADFA